MIPVYTAERDAGLGELVRSSSSVAYASEAQLSVRFEIPEKVRLHAGRASQSDFDLHYLKTVLATVGWNKNDDVFDPAETWLARHTPEDKPFNYEHNCSDIIGHITGSFVSNESGGPIAEDTLLDDLPAKFHVVTSAVLYKFWEKKELQERMDRLLAEITEGKWYVSMEALFKNFDYAMVSGDGSAKVVARNKETAFLTKHLRAYGGPGNYGDYKVGRLIRNFVFSGKGLVRKPANPESIIFTDFSPAVGYSASTQSQERQETMATELELQKKLAEAQLQIEQLQAALKDTDVKALRAELEQANAEKKKFQTAMEETKGKHAKMEEALKDAQEKHKKTEELLMAAKKHAEDLKSSHDELDKQHKAKLEEVMNAAKASESELATIKSEKKKAERILAVAERLKLPQEKAAALVEQLNDLDDAKFEAVIKASQDMMTEKPATNNPLPGNTNFSHDLKVSPVPQVLDNKQPKATDKPIVAPMQAHSNANADPSNLNTAEPQSDAALSTAGEVPGVGNLRMAIAKHFGYEEK